MENILKNIKQIRENFGYSQENMASELSMAQSSYGLIENGKRKLTYEKLEQIAIVFNCETIDIITYPNKYVDKELFSNESERISIKDIDKVKIEHCTQCLEKEVLLRQLSNYIDILEDKLSIIK